MSPYGWNRRQTMRNRPWHQFWNSGYDGIVMPIRLHKTVGVKVGRVQVGGGAPVAVQSMTNTDTPDVESTARQCIELAEAGSELVRITVNLSEAAAAVPAIKQRMLD